MSQVRVAGMVRLFLVPAAGGRRPVFRPVARTPGIVSSLSLGSLAGRLLQTAQEPAQAVAIALRANQKGVVMAAAQLDQLLWPRRSVQQPPGMAHVQKFVVAAVKNEQRGVDLADPGQRSEER